MDLDQEMARAGELIEAVIRGLGLDPDALQAKVPEGAGRGWSLMRGSAPLAILLRPPREGEDSPQLRIVAPIVNIDREKCDGLFEELLALNAGGLGAVAFGMQHDRVLVVAERRTVDLEPREVQYLVERVGAVADHYDDRLIARFGGSRVGDRA